MKLEEDWGKTYDDYAKLQKKFYDGIEIVVHSDKACEIPNYYNRIVEMTADKKGKTYWVDTCDTSDINYQNTESFEFKLDWRYTPMFRILDIMEFNTNFAVFLMLFIFIAIICLAAVFVIA